MLKFQQYSHYIKPSLLRNEELTGKRAFQEVEEKQKYQLITQLDKLSNIILWKSRFSKKLLRSIQKSHSSLRITTERLHYFLEIEN